MSNEYHNTFDYANGYSASIVSHDLSMGGRRGFFELALLHLEQGKLCYAIEEFNHPIGWLSFDQVMPLLVKIRALHENPLCNHRRKDEE